MNLSQSGVCEPALAEHFSNNELVESVMNGMILNFPSLLAHSQVVERAIRLEMKLHKLSMGKKQNASILLLNHCAIK